MKNHWKRLFLPLNGVQSTSSLVETHNKEFKQKSYLQEGIPIFAHHKWDSNLEIDCLGEPYQLLAKDLRKSGVDLGSENPEAGPEMEK